MRQLKYLLTLIILLGFSPLVHAGVAVVASPDSPFSSLSETEVKRLFLGKSQSVDGKRATPVDQVDGKAIKDEFYDKVVNKDSARLKAYWSKQIFSGKGTPPASVGGDDDVKAWLKRNSNGIGYIDASKVDSSVKVLIKIP